jgi:hypothetical protein
MRADLVQAEKNEDQRIRDAREGELLVGEGDNNDEGSDQRVLERPVVPV